METSATPSEQGMCPLPASPLSQCCPLHFPLSKLLTNALLFSAHVFLPLRALHLVPARLPAVLGRELGGFDFQYVHRNESIMSSLGAGSKLPKTRKTGTTICGALFAGGVVLGADTRATEDSTVRALFAHPPPSPPPPLQSYRAENCLILPRCPSPPPAPPSHTPTRFVLCKPPSSSPPYYTRARA